MKTLISLLFFGSLAYGAFWLDALRPPVTPQIAYLNSGLVGKSSVRNYSSRRPYYGRTYRSRYRNRYRSRRGGWSSGRSGRSSRSRSSSSYRSRSSRSYGSSRSHYSSGGK